MMQLVCHSICESIVASQIDTIGKYSSEQQHRAADAGTLVQEQ
jgi:hypothetical protein